MVDRGRDYDICCLLLFLILTNWQMHRTVWNGLWTTYRYVRTYAYVLHVCKFFSDWLCCFPMIVVIDHNNYFCYYHSYNHNWYFFLWESLSYWFSLFFFKYEKSEAWVRTNRRWPHTNKRVDTPGNGHFLFLSLFLLFFNSFFWSRSD